MNGTSTAAALILYNGRITTLDRSNPTATAVAIGDGKFVRVGRDADVMSLAGSATRVIDLKGRRVLPGLIDNIGLGERRGEGALQFDVELSTYFRTPGA